MLINCPNYLPRTSFLGKALRIDVDGRDEGLEYAIPPDNPYLDDQGALRELFAIGLRNPWRVFYDPEEDSGMLTFIHL